MNNLGRGFLIGYLIACLLEYWWTHCVHVWLVDERRCRFDSKLFAIRRRFSWMLLELFARLIVFLYGSRCMGACRRNKIIEETFSFLISNNGFNLVFKLNKRFRYFLSNIRELYADHVFKFYFVFVFRTSSDQISYFIELYQLTYYPDHQSNFSFFH